MNWSGPSHSGGWARQTSVAKVTGGARPVERRLWAYTRTASITWRIAASRAAAAAAAAASAAAGWRRGGRALPQVPRSKDGALKKYFSRLPALSVRVSPVGSVTVWRRSRAGSPVRYPAVPRYPVESDLSRSSPVQYAPALCPVLSPVGSDPTTRSRVNHHPFATCLRRSRARSLSRFEFL